LLTALLTTLLVTQTTPNTQSPPLVFTDVTVIDMTGAPPQPAMTVVVSGGRITAITSNTR
jgi:hypothetical protein